MDLRHHGNWIPVLTLSDQTAPRQWVGSTIYQCPLCWALTLQANDHADWHIWRGDFPDRRAIR